ncbi:MAG: alpha-1,2-fucosyltransferase [Actinomycetes bacterium]
MIIVQIIGGLGNQMFQYAFGRRLADGLGVRLKLDVTPFATFYDKRRYILGGLRIEEDFASAHEIDVALHGRFPAARGRLRRVFPSLPSGSGRLGREKGFRFDSSMLELRDGAYLEGYWQSERYFDAVADRLRVEFMPRTPPSAAAAELARQMGRGESVSLHVRRGDYVSEPEVARIHQVCDETYYARCLEYLAPRLNDPHFYVFSDEPDWVREHLHVPFPTTIVADHYAATEVEDLWLMAQCRHHVIANSSFSWWGAWLDARQSKIVVMPRRWFNDREPEHSADIRPPGWVAL